MHSPILSQWVGSLDAFTKEYWHRRPGVFKPDCPPTPFTIEDLDVALSGGLLRSPYLVMTRTGPDGKSDPLLCTSSRMVHQATYEGFADEGQIIAQLEHGGTLLLHRIDQWHAPTRELLASLAVELGRRIEAFFFVTPAGEQGLPLHRDDADVIVVQITGSKRWYVHAGPESGDWRPDKVPDGETPAELLQVTLHPGEVLYIPRGFAHRAAGSGGLSTHLSLTIREVITRDLLRSLQRALLEGLELAQRPVGDEALTATVSAAIDHFRERIADISADEILDAAREIDMKRLPSGYSGPRLSTLAETWNAAERQ